MMPTYPMLIKLLWVVAGLSLILGLLRIVHLLRRRGCVLSRQDVVSDILVLLLLHNGGEIPHTLRFIRRSRDLLFAGSKLDKSGT